MSVDGKALLKLNDDALKSRKFHVDTDRQEIPHAIATLKPGCDTVTKIPKGGHVEALRNGKWHGGVQPGTR